MKRKSLAIQLVMSFIVTSIIPIVLINLMSYYSTVQIVNENNIDLMEYNLNRTKTALEISIESYEDILYQIYSDDNVIELINKINRGEELVVSKNQLRRILRGYFYAKEYIKDISVITENGTLVFYDSITGSTTRNAWIPDLSISQDELYKQLKDCRKTCLMPTEKVARGAEGIYYLFHMGRRIVDFRRKNENIGAVILSIDEKLLYNICTGGEDDLTAYNFIVDGEGHLISYRKKELLGSVIEFSGQGQSRSAAYHEFAEEQDLFFGDAVFVNDIQDEKTGWDIVNVSNQNEILGKIKKQQRITFTVMSVSVTVLAVMIIFLIHRLTGSVKTVVKIMQSAGEGDFSKRVIVDAKMPSEVEVIARQYNITMDRLLESLEKEKDLDRQKRNAEIMALEAQLNPHFLYNTLDAINWIAIGEKEYEISRSITALAKILRYGIDNSNGIVTVRDEYEWLQQYLLLQQMRLKDGVQIQIDIPEYLMEVNVHKLLIQPFVENSFVHGFKGIGRKPMLRISMERKENKLFIIVEDNGRGMQKRAVERINSGFLPDAGEKNHIGLKNALYRIQLYYEKQAKIRVESREGEYTRIWIALPILAERKEDKK